jgi:hypothetical protein
LRDKLGHNGQVLLQGVGNIQRVRSFLARDSWDSLEKINLSGAFCSGTCCDTWFERWYKALETFSVSGASGEGLTGLAGENHFVRGSVERLAGTPWSSAPAGRWKCSACFMHFWKGQQDSPKKMNLSGAFRRRTRWDTLVECFWKVLETYIVFHALWQGTHRTRWKKYIYRGLSFEGLPSELLNRKHPTNSFFLPNPVSLSPKVPDTLNISSAL